ncbi:hypothetical protein ACFYZE_12940 [Streptomyces sp. NPDC001796]
MSRAGLDLDNVGFVIVGSSVVVWAAAFGHGRPAKAEERRAPRPADGR